MVEFLVLENEEQNCNKSYHSEDGHEQAKDYPSNLAPKCQCIYMSLCHDFDLRTISANISQKRPGYSLL